MTEHDPEFPERFEAFLDDILKDEEKRDVGNEVESSEYWSSQVELQRRIDQSVKRQYQPPENLDIVPAELSSVINGDV